MICAWDFPVEMRTPSSALRYAAAGIAATHRCHVWFVQQPVVALRWLGDTLDRLRILDQLARIEGEMGHAWDRYRLARGRRGRYDHHHVPQRAGFQRGFCSRLGSRLVTPPQPPILAVPAIVQRVWEHAGRPLLELPVVAVTDEVAIGDGARAADGVDLRKL